MSFSSPVFFSFFCSFEGSRGISNRYRPKGVFGKGVGNSKNASETRQKCVKNASKWVKMGLVLLGKEERSQMRQKCVKIASKLRQKCAKNALGENTLNWTIPIKTRAKAPVRTKLRLKRFLTTKITCCCWGQRELEKSRATLRDTKNSPNLSGAKRGISIKNLGRNPPSQTHPPRTPDPANSLCLGPLFPSKYRKEAYIKNFERGGSWGPQNSLCWISSRAFSAPESWIALYDSNDLRSSF